MSNYSEQFLKQSPLAVLGVLRDLHKEQVPICITWGSGQFISKILDADPDRLVVDLGSQEYENKAVQRVDSVTITAETRGAKVEFTASGLSMGDFQTLPAFVTPLPTSLWFIQRREYFRISAPLHPAYFGKATLPDKSPMRFRLFDLSLGGMGALLEGATPESVKEGQRFSQIELDMGGWGQFYFDAQLISISERKVVDGKNDTVTTPRLSFRFLNINPAVERELQRIIFSLEREARERASRVR
ncbi:flagellar brake protein [Pseudescherichia sp.]|uniref:flagellar brake protein YcgR n=1 Tax=Pseudescherichia sp. TaxID=2055881 RepID=UPI0028A044AE|nr:flagellar brake protein [Pseudescherichia sp.]